jgi:methylenetetrahydrofolate dehydrogenase (NADP+)/methenyltetrahydrofolate cyclohydrolase
VAQILDGRQVAAAYKTKLAAEAAALKQTGKACKLAVVLVDGDAASRVYANSLMKLAGSLGVGGEIIELAAQVTQEELLAAIDRCNHDETITGILPMMPLPKHLDADMVATRIDPAKDVDALHPLSAGLVQVGKSRWAPCTPRAVMAILDYYHIDIAGRHVVIIGRSNIVGKPLVHLLLGKNATVTICHSKTENLTEVVKQGDIVIAAVGKPRLIGRQMIKHGAVVIDVGINEEAGNLVGDVDFDQVATIAAAITPVPGGVGVVSNVMVMEAVLEKKN